VVGFLSGEARQGRVGVGWATLVRVDVAAAFVPTLVVTDVDRALDEIVATTGAGSAAVAMPSCANCSAAPRRRKPTSSGGSSVASSARVRSPG